MDRPPGPSLSGPWQATGTVVPQTPERPTAGGAWSDAANRRISVTFGD